MVRQITCKWGVFRTVKEYSGNYFYQTISLCSFLLYDTACISSFILPSCYSCHSRTIPGHWITCSPGLLSIPWTLPHLRPVCMWPLSAWNSISDISLLIILWSLLICELGVSEGGLPRHSCLVCDIPVCVRISHTSHNHIIWENHINSPSSYSP